MSKRTLSNLLSKENMKYKENIVKFRKLNETANILGEDVSFASRLENDDIPSTSRAALGYSDAHTFDDDNLPSTSRAPSENSIVDHYDLSEDEDDRYLFEDFEESESHVDESLNINVDKFAKIKAFALRSKLSQNDVTDMLKTLREIGCEGLPLSARTLLGTSREKVDLKSIPGGELLYIGIEFYLNCSKYNFLENQEEVSIDVGIDGLKLFKCADRCLWPILGYVVGSNLNPFVIACFSGTSKPENVNDFLEDFCEDVIALNENGIKVGENEIVKKFNVRLFTCDAPARAFVTGVMYHNAKNSCSKCVSRGQSLEGRVAFETTISELRTDLSFKNRLDISHHNPKFREAELLLETANIGMVSQFPIDPMHLVDIGVTKKLLKLISVFGNVTRMNEKLSFLKSFIPSDFSRLSRDLDQLHNWKSTELRQFLLYTGPFVLRDCIPEKYYIHFLLLSASIRILSCDRSHIVESNVAREMLKLFVHLYADYYAMESQPMASQPACSNSQVDTVQRIQFQVAVPHEERMRSQPPLNSAQTQQTDQQTLVELKATLSRIEDKVDKIQKTLTEKMPERAELQAQGVLLKECKVMSSSVHRSISRITGDIISEEYTRVRSMLPLASQESLTVLEELLGNKAYVDTTLNIILKIKGAKGSVKDVLKSIFADPLTAAYNYEGRGSKAALLGLKVMDLVFDAFATTPKQELIDGIRRYVFLSHNRHKQVVLKRKRMNS